MLRNEDKSQEAAMIDGGKDASNGSEKACSDRDPPAEVDVD